MAAYSKKSAADLLGVSIGTVNRLLQTKELRAERYRGVKGKRFYEGVNAESVNQMCECIREKDSLISAVNSRLVHNCFRVEPQVRASIKLEYPTGGPFCDAVGRLEIVPDFFFQHSGTVKVKRLFKVGQKCRNRDEVMKAIRQYLEAAKEVADKNVKIIEQELRIVAQAAVQYPHGSYLNIELEKYWMRLEQQKKQVLKNRDKAERWAEMLEEAYI